MVRRGEKPVELDALANMPEGVLFLGNTADPFELNPHEGELVFDPAYAYGPNQGIRGFLGARVLLN